MEGGVDEFIKSPTHYSIDVGVRNIVGSLGNFVKRPSGHYAYILNGVSHSNFLQSNDDRFLRSYGYGQYSLGTPLEALDINKFYDTTKRLLVEFLNHVQVLDYIVQNEQQIVSEFNKRIDELRKKYSTIRITTKRTIYSKENR